MEPARTSEVGGVLPASLEPRPPSLTVTGLGSGPRPRDSLITDGFNAALLCGDRSERIFAHHLQRLGIDRVLDIGSNSGQFGAKLRRLGFGGVIYSVEPQAAAYGELLANARADLKWFPLARQGAGAAPLFMQLNVSENSYSASLREVHDNHLRAEPKVRTVRTEDVFVNVTHRLLRADAMQDIEALKIDVQGYEDEVIEGYLPLIDGVRLLLVELSIVECYRGGPDLFSLDDRLVNQLGFSRVSLEPSYYDDKVGVVQQYDGIYFRPERPARSKTRAPVRVGAVVTSIGGSLERRLPDGSDLGPAWLQMCMQSWHRIGVPVMSVAEQAPPDGLHWVRSDARPSLSQMLAASQVAAASYVLLTNADIVITDALWDILGKLDSEGVYYGCRVDVEREANAQSGLVSRGAYEAGFDYFLLPAELVGMIIDEQLIPEELRIGQPWWDYLLPLLALARGFPLKKLCWSTPLALHYAHPVRYSEDLWLRNREVFMQIIGRLLRDPRCHARGILSEIMANKRQIPHIICRCLP